MVLRNNDGSLACICHEHNGECKCIENEYLKAAEIGQTVPVWRTVLRCIQRAFRMRW